MSAATPNSFLKIYGWPFVFGVLSVVGLLAALLGDGLWDGLSWVTLGVPLVVIAGCFSKRSR